MKVRLYRPFSVESFHGQLAVNASRSLAVLDRTKEAGAVGEPLYLDVVTAVERRRRQGRHRSPPVPAIIGGRYGLSSKEFTPAMVKAVFDELAKTARRRITSPSASSTT